MFFQQRLDLTSLDDMTNQNKLLCTTIMNFMTIMIGSEDNVACAACRLYFAAVKENRRAICHSSGFLSHTFQGTTMPAKILHTLSLILLCFATSPSLPRNNVVFDIKIRMTGRSTALLECRDNNLSNQHCFGGAEGAQTKYQWLEMRIIKKCSNDFWQTTLP